MPTRDTWKTLARNVLKNTWRERKRANRAAYFPASGLDIYLACDKNDIGHVAISSRPLRMKLFTAEIMEGCGQGLTGAPPVFSAAAVQARAGLFRFHTPKAPLGGFASTPDRADPGRRRQRRGPIVLIAVRSVGGLLPQRSSERWGFCGLTMTNRYSCFGLKVRGAPIPHRSG